jgi:hypothetical protein
MKKEGKGLENKPFLYRPRTVARQLDINIREVYALVRKGQLIAHSYHDSMRGLWISAASVEEFIKRTRIHPQKWLK